MAARQAGDVDAEGLVRLDREEGAEARLELAEVLQEAERDGGGDDEDAGGPELVVGQDAVALDGVVQVGGERADARAVRLGPLQEEEEADVGGFHSNGQVYFWRSGKRPRESGARPLAREVSGKTVGVF